MTAGSYEFTSAEVDDLLAELDRRLRTRGAYAAIFVVGGAAVAAAGLRAGRLTEDVDAFSHDVAVSQEAVRIADVRGIPGNWLNSRALMWMPPLPDGVLDEPDQPGLRVTYADAGFLFATKLVAQRLKDVDDLIALADHLGMRQADAATLEAHVRRYYTDLGALELILGGDDVDQELRYLAADAARLLASSGPAEEQP